MSTDCTSPDFIDITDEQQSNSLDKPIDEQNQWKRSAVKREWRC
jgi:hypothetical protein